MKTSRYFSPWDDDRPLNSGLGQPTPNLRARLKSHLTWFRAALLILAVTLSGLLSETAKGQGALTNGWTHTGTIAPIGDSDSWTFTANTGDSLVIRIGKITQTNSFTPRIRLINPLAVQQASTFGSASMPFLRNTPCLSIT